LSWYGYWLDSLFFHTLDMSWWFDKWFTAPFCIGFGVGIFFPIIGCLAFCVGFYKWLKWNWKIAGRQ